MDRLIRYFRSILPRNLIFVDVGARGGIKTIPWLNILPLIDVISFEPEPNEAARMLKAKRNNDQIFATALYRDAREVHLYVTRSPGSSSLYEPNYEFLESFPDKERFDIVAQERVKTDTLDHLYDQKLIKDADFIKLDVQGAELDILKGGTRLSCENILGIELEVEFQPLYKGQPLFSDVDPVIRDMGFDLQDIQVSYWKRNAGVGIGPVKGQAIFGDALYFRSPRGVMEMIAKRPREQGAEKILMACLFSVSYGYFDYSFDLLAQPECERYLEKEKIQSLRSELMVYSRSYSWNGKSAKFLSALGRFLYRAFEGDQKDWARIGERFGNRKRFGMFG
ncbi:MAG: FkbM family methyltransferase [Magnetococcales bacterium]|nr:FkbM family methyltransferase [Magnetococcales bacterium]